MGYNADLSALVAAVVKLHRKLLQQSFKPSVCKPYKDIQQEEARQPIKAIFDRPSE